MKQSERAMERKVSVLSRLSEAVKPRRLTEFGKDNRRVFNDLMAILGVGHPDMGGIEYRITCQAKH